MKKFFNNLIIILSLAVFIFIYNNTDSFASDTLRFVQLSDVHLSNRNDTTFKLLSDSRSLFLDAIKQINDISDVNFVMLTGDGIDQPIKSHCEEFIDLMNTLKYPWYMALGNHDTTTTEDLTKDCLYRIMKEKNPSFKFPYLFYTFKPKAGYRVLVLDGAKNKGISSNGNITQQQLDWLDFQLNEAKQNKEVVLIFLHFPIVEPFPSAHHKILNANDVKNILYKYDFPIAVFTGHYHTTKIVKIDNILHVTSPALVSYPNAFRLITVTNEKNKVVFDFKFYETNLKDVQEKAKLLTFGSSTYYGEDKDREVTITMDK